MTEITKQGERVPVEELTPEQLAAAKAVGAWVNQLGRTLKTCRLYDAANPTVIRFRQELAVALMHLLEEHGEIRVRFGVDDVLCEGISVAPARSRDDNLALPFYRDGVRGMTFSPGVEPIEVNAVVDAVLQVTGQHVGEDDLVTLLWQAHLRNIEVDYVPAESDLGGSPVAEGTESAEVALWPVPETDTAEQIADAQGSVVSTSVEESAEAAGRSDDWTIGEHTLEIEATFDELESLSASEVKRFQDEFSREHTNTLASAALAISRVYLQTGANESDRAELARFLPRVLRQAAAGGEWREARETVGLIRACDASDSALAMFSQELLQPISVTAIRERLELQDAGGMADFIAFAREFPNQTVDLLGLIYADLQNPRAQRLATEAVVDLCRENPERLIPWLADPRAHVVRHAVQVLSAIGGNAIVGLLATALQHSEPRVRYDALAALKSVDPRLSRPILLDTLEVPDTRMFCTALYQLAESRDPVVAQRILSCLQSVEFEKRPIEERRAIFSALAATGGDEVLPELEAELYKSTWFRNNDSHQQAVARCIARVGTPLAKEMLERGIQSKRAPVRKACGDALAGLGGHE